MELHWTWRTQRVDLQASQHRPRPPRHSYYERVDLFSPGLVLRFRRRRANQPHGVQPKLRLVCPPRRRRLPPLSWLLQARTNGPANCNSRSSKRNCTSNFPGVSNLASSKKTKKSNVSFVTKWPAVKRPFLPLFRCSVGSAKKVPRSYHGSVVPWLSTFSVRSKG